MPSHGGGRRRPRGHADRRGQVSLCYQLPGLMRGGPTLVFSPLIALMEDQTAKLRELGLRAERIHSGRPRSESRQACRLYRDGEVDFLFIAPERLGVPGFIEFLERCRPALIAVDEAHCISQWGHDFRPDYRLLGRRLPRLRPAPVLALTATATPRIQDDIAAQLDLEGDQRYIYGFRRENLAVEVVQKRPGARAAVVREVLGEEGPAAGDRLRADAQGDRGALGAPRRGLPDRRLPRRAADGPAGRGPGRVPRRCDRRCRRDDGIRHGDRQAGHSHGYPYRAAGDRRGVLPGDRPRRPRR